jgi:hypothetical protein
MKRGGSAHVVHSFARLHHAHKYEYALHRYLQLTRVPPPAHVSDPCAYLLLDGGRDELDDLRGYLHRSREGHLDASDDGLAYGRIRVYIAADVAHARRGDSDGFVVDVMIDRLGVVLRGVEVLLLLGLLGGAEGGLVLEGELLRASGLRGDRVREQLRGGSRAAGRAESCRHCGEGGVVEDESQRRVEEADETAAVCTSVFNECTYRCKAMVADGSNVQDAPRRGTVLSGGFDPPSVSSAGD